MIPKVLYLLAPSPLLKSIDKEGKIIQLGSACANTNAVALRSVCIRGTWPLQ
jgi:hypothetical protein